MRGEIIKSVYECEVLLWFILEPQSWFTPSKNLTSKYRLCQEH